MLASKRALRYPRGGTLIGGGALKYCGGAPPSSLMRCSKRCTSPRRKGQEQRNFGGTGIWINAGGVAGGALKASGGFAGGTLNGIAFRGTAKAFAGGIKTDWFALAVAVASTGVAGGTLNGGVANG